MSERNEWHFRIAEGRLDSDYKLYQIHHPFNLIQLTSDDSLCIFDFWWLALHLRRTRMVGHRCATPSGSVISKYCSCWWTREVVILTSEFGNTTMGRCVGEQWGCNRECPSQLFTTLWVLVFFSFTYPNVAALMDIPYISRSSAVRPTLQVLPLIQSSTSFLPISFWPSSIPLAFHVSFSY